MKSTANWSIEEEKILIESYSTESTGSIAKKLNRSERSVYGKAFLLGLSKLEIPNKTKWSDEMICWLKENYLNYSNADLSSILCVGLTVVRNKMRELGLKKMDLEYFTKEQTQYLVANYKTKGDVEIAEYFQFHFPKKKPWLKQHICKKRKHMKLKRTPAEIRRIVSETVKAGGRRCTIFVNSASRNLPDNYVAQFVAWRDPVLQNKIIKQFPELIELKRSQLKLNQALKFHEKQK